MSYMTEDDAKHNICLLTLASAKANNCEASLCMAWRWRPLMADEAYLAAVKKATESHPGQGKAAAHVNANRASYGLPTKPFLGYCGLAGKPFE